MEINKSKGIRRSLQEKQDLFLQWKQSGQSRRAFCAGRGLNYHSFIAWSRQLKSKLAAENFTQVKIISDTAVFARVEFPSGMRIDFYRYLPLEYFQLLAKQ